MYNEDDFTLMYATVGWLYEIDRISTGGIEFNANDFRSIQLWCDASTVGGDVATETMPNVIISTVDINGQEIKVMGDVVL